jgi:hypothetical protein
MLSRESKEKKDFLYLYLFFCYSYDKQHTPVAKDDLLKVVEGPFRGKQGKVVHLYRFFAFLECREVLQNSGIINVKTDHCIVLGNNKKKKDNPYAPGATVLMSPSGHGTQGNPQLNKVKTNPTTSLLRSSYLVLTKQL